MKRFMKIGVVLVALGALICFASAFSAGFDLKKLSTVPEPLKVEKSFPAGQVAGVYVDLATESVRVETSQDDEVHVSYYTNEDDYTLELNNGVLNLTRRPFNVAGAFRLDFFFGDREAVISLPDGFSGDLTVRLTTGSFAAQSLRLLGDVDLQLTTGRARLNDIAANRVKIGCTTGNVSLSGIECDLAEAVCSTGNIYFERLNAFDLRFRTTTGSVTGELPGTDSDYTIVSHTNTGSNNLPANWGSGERRLEAESSTGSISVSFSGK